MSSCCAPDTARPLHRTDQCPESGTTGSTVDRQTVKALLTEAALGRLTQAEYRFCSHAGCKVVYFAADGRRFSTSDVRVPVWQKLPFGDRPVCYCFGESEASIRVELEATGRSLAVERIREHITAQRCACELRNPRGACCLGDMMGAVRRVEAAVVPETRVSTRAVTEKAHVR